MRSTPAAITGKRSTFSAARVGSSSSSSVAYSALPKASFERPSSASAGNAWDPIGANGSSGQRGRYGPPGNTCKNVMIAMGFVAFFAALAALGLWAWYAHDRAQDQDAIGFRLVRTELLVNGHAMRLDEIDLLLNDTVSRLGAVEAKALANMEKNVVQDGRLTAVETRSNALEDRVTAAEIKLLGVMANVTVLQAEVMQAQQDIVRIYADIGLLQQNASNHETRIQQLEQRAQQNSVQIGLLYQYLQGNLTTIDQRLDALNTTFTMTANGTAVLDGGNITVPVRWETRHFTATGGVDVEYLWISDSNWVPAIVKYPANEAYSFRVTNFTSWDGDMEPHRALPSPAISVDRPLLQQQQSKFIVTTNPAGQSRYVVSVKWNSSERSLEFKSTLFVNDGVTIARPLTFIIGFL